MAVDPAQIELAHDTASRAIAGEPGTARADCRADGRMKQRLGSPRERRAIAPAPSRRPSREHSNTSAMAATRRLVNTVCNDAEHHKDGHEEVGH